MTWYNWERQRATFFRESQLIFPAATDDVVGRTVSSVTIPLFIQDMPVVARKQKMTEINTINNQMPSIGGSTSGRGWDTSVQAQFYGTPEPLVVQISGYLITPLDSGNAYWQPTYDGRTVAAGGTAIVGASYHTYSDLILAYIEGRMSRNDFGRWRRVDPSKFIDPLGNEYDYPLVFSFESSYTVTPKKQTFNLQLWLESRTS